MGSETDSECKEVENVEGKASVSAVKPHACPYKGCHSSFNRPWKLERHICTHTKERPFKCDFPGCSKDYTNKSHLNRHKGVTHGGDKPLPVYIPCPFPDCKKVFMNKWSLKRHCNTHKAKKLYKCNLCGLDFGKNKQLQYHLYTHLGINPFVCETCKESYKTRKELRSHERKHKTYTCELEGCNEEFKTWNALRTHYKSCHLNLYQCDSCGKTYKNKWNLTEHVMSHLPVDNRDVLLCPHKDCGRYYFHQRNLRAHIKSFHENINHKCEVENCERSFTNKINLENHKRKLHGEPKIVTEQPTKPKQPRKPRKDKGIPRKSMAAMLSGIILPEKIDKCLAQSNITSEVLDCIKKVKEIVAQEIEKNETSETELTQNCV